METTYLRELWVNDYGYNKGTVLMMNWCQGDGSSSMGVRMDTIKLAMTGTQDWWCQFSPLSAC